MRRTTILMLAGCNSIFGIKDVGNRPDGGAADASVPSGDGGTRTADASIRTTDAPTPADAAPPDATPCMVVFVPATWDFMGLNEGMTSADKMFTIQNQGPTATMPVTLSLTGADKDQFEITSGTDTCTGLTLAASSGSCTAMVHFKPTGAGQRTAALTISTATCTKSAALTGLSLGAASDMCGAGTDCQSGNCTDARCCDKATTDCNGCYSCAVAGLEGTCSPVVSGNDPHSTCSGLACSSGGCDGAGNCTPSPTTTICATDPGCVNSPPTYGQIDSAGPPIHKCDGTTTDCPTATSTQPCAGSNICDSTGTQCQTGCSTDLDCVRGAFCDATTGKCTAGLATGSSCNRQRQCGNYGYEFCINGTCQDNCETGYSCNNNNSQWCAVQSNGHNQCTDTCNSGADCVAANAGSTCVNFDQCTCNNDGECSGEPASSKCIPFNSVKVCSCFYIDPNYPESCHVGDVCVNSAATDYYTACRTRSGFLCSSDGACASGVCSNGICN
jgi:hypothetical protein